MTPEEKDFLLAEFNTAWEMIYKIDDRRGTFTKFFTFLFLAVLGVVAEILSKASPINLLICILCTLLLLMSVAVGQIIIKVLKSERKANKRYRKKINLIREMFLSDSSNDKIIEYITKKDIGIKLYKNKEDRPQGDGETLTQIYTFIGYKQFIFIVLSISLWVYYLFFI